MVTTNDCVRAGVQGQTLELTLVNNRKTGRQVFRELMATRGLRSLYRGVSAAVMRAFIVSSSRFSAYEVTLWLFKRYPPEQHRRWVRRREQRTSQNMAQFKLNYSTIQQSTCSQSKLQQIIKKTTKNGRSKQEVKLQRLVQIQCRSELDAKQTHCNQSACEILVV